MDAARQMENAKRAAASLAALAEGNSLVVTHGNGPQVGLLALESGTSGVSGRYPLDVLGSESQGMVGYLLELALRNAIPDRAIATVLSQVVVDAADSAFSRPTKPIGPVYNEVEGRELAAQGWVMAADGAGVRRVVPAPEPLSILELPAIRALLAADVVTISAGGGGVPVVRDASGELRGIEGVVDKDLTAALLAIELGADALLLLTDVDAVWEQWGAPRSRKLRAASSRTMRRMALEPGSMGPKVEAAARFAEATGGIAAIGSLDGAAGVLNGTAGTRVLQGAGGTHYWEETDE